MIRLRYLLIVMLVLFCLCLHPATVRADIAPPKPPVGTNLEPGSEQTNVRMVAETVVMDVPTWSQYATGQATVTAIFQMRNLSELAEQMDVRFPLCLAGLEGASHLDAQGYYSFFPPIERFAAWVNGVAVPVTVTSESLTIPDGNTFAQTEVPCWANFSVAFPPHQDVTVQVQYIQVAGYGGYGKGMSAFVTLDYVLFTGAGWKDTIGEADITVRLPVEAENLVPLRLEPQSAEVLGKEIHWRFEDFEPGEELGRIKLGFLQPMYWLKIQQERANAAAHPADGEAWGQLGKAIKNAYLWEHGFINEAAYWEGVSAYEKAIELLPADADWHYGFAELLCNNAMWDRRVHDSGDALAPYRLCIDQLDQTLALQPAYEKANELKALVEGFERAGLPQVEATALPATTTPTASISVTRTPRPAIRATLAPSATPLGAADLASPKAEPFLCGTPLLPAVAVTAFFFKQRWAHSP